MGSSRSPGGRSGMVSATYGRPSPANAGGIRISDSFRKMFDSIQKERGFHLSEETRAFTFAKGEDKPKCSAPMKDWKGLAPVSDQISRAKSAFTLAVGRAGIRDSQFHDLRHCRASHLAMRGASQFKQSLVTRPYHDHALCPPEPRAQEKSGQPDSLVNRFLS
jgi:integrase